MSRDLYGLGQNINNEWMPDWEEVISTDQHYDGDFLIRLVTHKLGLMTNYFEKVKISVSAGDFNTSSNVDDILKDMKSCYELGLKILNFEYGKEADEFYERYGTKEWLISEFEDESYKEWDRLTSIATADREKDIEKLFTKIGKKVNKWWV